jgi:hypothetical protein
MDWFLKACTAIGFVTLCGCIVLFVVAIWSYIHDHYPPKRTYNKAYAEGRRDARFAILGESWWFSEDETTMLLLKDLSEMNVSDARENWRKRRKENSAERLSQ